jgi:alkanesulfonate monooxygenase SsuD/methylene tetrahydromethanopterin reductase-like flavin-dependent oxidoreductase (luciferase family)
LILAVVMAYSGSKKAYCIRLHCAQDLSGIHSYQERSGLLDTLLHEVGRQPHDVQRTIALWVFCGRNEAELEARIAYVRQSFPALAPLPLAKLFEAMRSHISLFVGAPTEVIERLRAYEAAGVSEVMLQWGGVDDQAGLELLAEHVLPHFQK